jgi:hypothetical protein
MGMKTKNRVGDLGGILYNYIYNSCESAVFSSTPLMAKMQLVEPKSTFGSLMCHPWFVMVKFRVYLPFIPEAGHISTKKLFLVPFPHSAYSHTSIGAYFFFSYQH